MVATRNRRDDGFSLTELIVVLALLGVVLGISYQGMRVVMISRDVSDRQAMFAREMSSPLNAFEEVISQTLKVEQAGPYSMTVLTDADNDNSRERNTIQATTAGQLTQRRWATDAAFTNTELKLDAVWSDHNTNQADAAPMFLYFDKDGNPTTVADDARVVQVILHVVFDGRDYQDSRTILMRNR